LVNAQVGATCKSLNAAITKTKTFGKDNFHFGAGSVITISQKVNTWSGAVRQTSTILWVEM